MKLLIPIAPFSPLCLFNSYGLVTGIGNIITSGKIGSFVPCLMVKVVASCYVFMRLVCGFIVATLYFFGFYCVWYVSFCLLSVFGCFPVTWLDQHQKHYEVKTGGSALVGWEFFSCLIVIGTSFFIPFVDLAVNVTG